MKPEHVGHKGSGGNDAEPARTIERAKQQLQHMIDLNPQVMLLVQRDTTVVRANRALLALTGLPDFPEVLGKRLGEIFVGQEQAWFERMLGEQAGFEAQEAQVRLPNGLEREMGFTVIGSRRDLGLFVVLVTDVTAEKERAARLERRHKREAAAALMGGLMHSINQPLTVIAVTTKLMDIALEKREPDVHEMKQHLQTIAELTMRVKATLERVRELDDFVTESYVRDLEILDIERSVRARGGRDEAQARCGA